MNDRRSIGALADALLAGAARQARLSLGELLRLIGDRSFGAVLVLAAGTNLSPAGMVPTVSTVLAGVVAFTSLQIVAGLQHIWLPRFLRQKTVSRRIVESTGRTMKKWSSWLDPWLTRGLHPLARKPFDRVAALICILLSLTVPFLEFLPWVTNVPMTIIAIFGLGLLVRNGLLMGVGFAASLIVACFVYRLLLS
ncbi:exopolysaccharide biosynthesis protein [Ensifer sp. WSM1721]|uniref:exopolysaccharide biosynthesis protein n=1 Tax=Ensifer sp. WSM1721 TaxID=1041159 RepID=UPI00068634DF